MKKGIFKTVFGSLLACSGLAFMVLVFFDKANPYMFFVYLASLGIGIWLIARGAKDIQNV